jgi:hypothetical protein
MATNERWIEIVRIGSSIFVWTMKASANFSTVGLFIEVDSSS